MKNKWLLLTLGIVISIVSLFYVFHGVSRHDIIDAFRRIHPGYLAVSLALYWGGLVVCRTFLVKYLLKDKAHIPFVRIYRCIGIGFLANNVLPFRLGDLTRSFAVAKAGHLTFSTVLGATAFERMVDFLMAAVIAFAAVMTVPVVPWEIQITALVAGVILCTAFVFIILVVRRIPAEKTNGNRLLVFVWNTAVRFSRGFSSIGNFKGIVTILAIGLVMWSIGVLSITFKLAAFDLQPQIPTALLLFACLGFAVALPSAPGYVGVYQVACVVALTAIGVEKEIAATFGLFSWVADVATGNLIGAIGMTLEGMTLKELKHVTPDDN